MQKIYLDYAATTPVDPEVEKVIRPYFLTKFGNPGSLHSFGQEAIAAVDDSREKIANAIGAGFREIIFTGSATEANNLALRGVVKNLSNIKKPRIIISAVEHESVLETAKDLEKEGVEVIIIPVSRDGIVSVKEISRALTEETVLVSVMYVNNEIGTIQQIERISKAVKEFRGSRPFPLFHTDAAQAFQYLDCNVDALDVDLMTLSAHKMYGPKGIGALYVRNKKEGRDVAPVETGGGQEFGLRSGTENVPLIVGFAEAVEMAVKKRKLEYSRVLKLREVFWKQLKKIVRDAEKNGGGDIAPHILNVYFPSSDDLLIKLDIAGVAVSSGSACSARSQEPSYVVQALGYSKERAEKSIRFSFGRQTKEEELKKVVAILEGSHK